MDDIEISVIVAVYSEEKSLIETIERLLKRDRGYIKEIILVVSPYSSGKCLQACEGLVKRCPVVKMHIQENNPGQGLAFREGIGLASGSHIAIMSADLETEPEAIDRMVRRIEETGCDIVTANRWLSRGWRKEYGTMKYICNFIFQRICMVLFHTKISDLTFGFRIFKSHIVKDIEWKCMFHDFCLESMLKPIRLGKYIEEVPVKWERRKEGNSRNSLFGYVRYFWAVLRIFFMEPGELRAI